MGRKFGYEIIALVIHIREGRTYEPIKLACTTKGKETTIDWEEVPAVEGKVEE